MLNISLLTTSLLNKLLKKYQLTLVAILQKALLPLKKLKKSFALLIATLAVLNKIALTKQLQNFKKQLAT